MARSEQAERPLLRSRASTDGPEQALLTGALASFCTSFRAPSIVLQEVHLPTGVPDAVAVLLRDSDVAIAHERLGLSAQDLRLFQHISTVRHSCVRDLAIALRWGTADLLRSVSALQAAGFLWESTNLVHARKLADIFLARQIIAIEAKMTDWRRAVDQAIANTWFASHSYILLPDRPLGQAVLTEAARFGVGVLTFDGVETRTRLRAVARKLPASYGSWLIHESALRIAQDGR
jgi:hypothetical protein